MEGGLPFGLRSDVKWGVSDGLVGELSAPEMGRFDPGEHKTQPCTDEGMSGSSGMSWDSTGSGTD
jgi:hypothetical protein